MKQTNNALKFLLAQYRAIFKQAYVKGLASAVILTAGLSIGATANAANAGLTQLASGGTVTVDGTADQDNGPYQYLQVTASGTGSWAADVTISSGSGAASTGNFVISSGSGASLTGEGSLTIQGGAGLLIQNSGSGVFTVGLNSEKGVDIQNGSLTLEASGGTVNFTTTTLTLGDGTNSGSLTLSGASGSAVTVLNSLTVNSGSSLVVSGSGAHTINIGSGEESTATATFATGSTINNSGSLTLKGVAAEQAVDIQSNVTFASGANLILDTGAFDLTLATLTSASGAYIQTSGSGTTAEFSGSSLTAFLSGSGSLVLKAGTTASVDTLDTSDVTISGSTSGAGVIAGESSSTLKVGELTLSSSGSASPLNIEAQTLNLNYASGSAYASGSLTVTQTLNVQNSSGSTLESEIVLTAADTTGTVTGAALTLGSGGSLDITGEWTFENSLTINSGSVAINSGSNVSFDNGSALTITSGTVTIASGSTTTFANDSVLTVTSGSLTVNNAALDISNADVKSGSGSIIASGASAEITISSLADGIKYVASSGTFKASSLEISGSQIAASDNAGIYLNNGKLVVDTLSLTDNTAISSGNGTIQVNQSLSAKSGSITFSGSGLSLQLGTADTTAGTIGSDLVIANKATVLGTWSTEKALSVSGSGTLKVGDGTGAGTLSATTLNADTSASVTVNKNSTLTVEGNTTAAGSGASGDYGFGLSGSTITVDGGTFVIGATAAEGLLTDKANWTDTESASGAVTYENFGEYTLENGGVLQINFADTVTLSLNELVTLKDDLAGATDGIIADGSLNIGGAQIEGITEGDTSIIQTDPEDGSQFIDYNDYAQVSDVLTDVQQADVANAKITEVGGTFVGGNVGSLQLSSGTTNTEVKGNTTLNNADSNGNLIADASGSAADATVSAGTVLSLSSDGKVSDITLTSGSDGDLTTLNLNAANNLDSISGDAFTLVEVGASGNTTVSGDTSVETLKNNNIFTGNTVAVTNFSDTATATTTANTMTVSGKTSVDGTLVIKDSLTLDASAADESKVNGNVSVTNTLTAGNIEFSETSNVQTKQAVFDGNVALAGNFNAESTTIGDTNKAAIEVVVTSTQTDLGDVSMVANSAGTGSNLIVLGQAITNNFSGSSGALIEVGLDTPLAENETTTGSLDIQGVLSLNGATLKVDPAYTENTALVSVNSLGSAATDKTDVGIFDGMVFVGQNSALGVGTSFAQLQEIVAQYQENGHLLDPSVTGNEDAYGAILYLDRPATVGAGQGITLTATTAEDLYNTINTSVSGGISSSAMNGFDPTSGDYGVADTIFFGDNTALLVNTDATLKDGQAYITFANGSGNLVANGGEIVLYGETLKKTYQLFSNNSSVVNVDNSTSGAAITVKSENNFLVGTLSGSSGSVTLSVNEAEAATIMTGASNPVYDTILAYARGYNGAYVDEADPANQLYASYDADTNTYDTNYNNYFLSKVVYSAGNAADVEKVARLGVYGGAAQAALAAGSSTYEAVNSRMGVGAQTGSITFADNGQGAGLWLTPIYKNHDSDSFDAQGVSYGADMDLYGVALGADYTLANGLRLGAAFNVGSGDADGQGAGSGVSNDFDYYGFTVYGGYTLDKLSIVGDISYTVVDNDVEANTQFEKVSASMDSTNLSVGVTAQYGFDVSGVDVTPHAGMRYTYIDMDDYTVKGTGEIAKYDADSASIFSIPVGVTVSKDIAAGEWTIKPAFDLTLTANMGDDSIDGSVSWAGVENLKTNLESEVLDSFTYGATLGVAAKSGNLSLGFGINYTGASNADEFGVNANARFVF